MPEGEGHRPDFGAIFAAAPEPYLILDRDLVIVGASEAYLRATNTERDGIMDRHVFDVFPDNPDDPGADGVGNLRQSFERVLRHRRPDVMPIQKYDIPRPDGGFELRYWRPVNTPVLDGAGRASWIIHHVEDVTETVLLGGAVPREEAEREQRRINEQLRAANRELLAKSEENLLLQQHKFLLANIVETSQDAIISKTIDGVVSSWNPAAERMFGYRAEEILGRPITLLFPPELVHEEGMIIERLKAGERIEHYETRRRHKDGRDLTVSLSVSAIRDSEGRLLGASKIVRDITERKEAEDRLSELQSELIHVARWNTVGIMASSVAHDLNQPLAASANYLSALRRLLSMPEPNLDRAAEILDKATKQTRRAADIVQHLRNFVARGEPDRKPEDLEAVAREALDLAATAIKPHRVATALEAERGLAPVRIDRVQIQQLLVNLLRNAAEAMADSKTRIITLRIGRAREEDAILMQVADTGPGLPDEILARLFQPFSTTKPNGMGLGLSICQEIAKAHGGELSATPNGASGTVFTLTLPLGAQNAAV
jgi:two-component system sensor kinase FixL